jgi:hypothetical protein
MDSGQEQVPYLPARLATKQSVIRRLAGYSGAATSPGADFARSVNRQTVDC